jgi:hypothetical protein
MQLRSQLQLQSPLQSPLQLQVSLFSVCSVVSAVAVPGT